MRAIAWGVGVQSTALVVLAGTGRIDFPVALFANVGDDSEHPATLDYFHSHARPWAENHGIEVHELHRIPTRGVSGGRIETLWQRLMRDGSRSLPIPVRMADTGAPGTRSCTADFKIKVIARWLKAHGATATAPATVAIGISTDEIERLNNRVQAAHEQVVYPLIDLRLSRQDCTNIITRAGLPIPHKSACFFCPFHRPQTWAEMRRDEPGLFAKSVLLEDTLNARRDTLGKDRVYLTRFGKPLTDAVAEAQPTLFDGPEGCDTGYCWT